jgi:hypothetical protein
MASILTLAKEEKQTPKFREAITYSKNANGGNGWTEGKESRRLLCYIA